MCVSHILPQSLVQTVACEVEETQIFFSHHAAEVIAAETNRITVVKAQESKGAD